MDAPNKPAIHVWFTVTVKSTYKTFITLYFRVSARIDINKCLIILHCHNNLWNNLINSNNSISLTVNINFLLTSDINCRRWPREAVFWYIVCRGTLRFVFHTEVCDARECLTIHVPRNSNCEAVSNTLVWNCVIDNTSVCNDWTSVLLPLHHRSPVTAVVHAATQVDSLILSDKSFLIGCVIWETEGMRICLKMFIKWLIDRHKSVY